MAKIFSKSQGAVSKVKCFLAKNRYFVIITFKMLKMEFKFEYTRLTKKELPILASLLKLRNFNISQA